MVPQTPPGELAQDHQEVEYVGEVDEAGKYELLGSAVAMLNPIQWAEPFGLVMIEALACGTPVVTTSAGSVPEIIDDGRTGFISDEHPGQGPRPGPRAEPGDVQQTAVSRFSTERMVADHVDLYAGLLGGLDTRR